MVQPSNLTHEPFVVVSNCSLEKLWAAVIQTFKTLCVYQFNGKYSELMGECEGRDCDHKIYCWAQRLQLFSCRTLFYRNSLVFSDFCYLAQGTTLSIDPTWDATLTINMRKETVYSWVTNPMGNKWNSLHRFTSGGNGGGEGTELGVWNEETQFCCYLGY